MRNRDILPTALLARSDEPATRIGSSRSQLLRQMFKNLTVNNYVLFFLDCLSVYGVVRVITEFQVEPNSLLSSYTDF
jgi:hypothetical protein